MWKELCDNYNDSDTYAGCAWDMLWERIKDAHTTGSSPQIAQQYGKSTIDLVTIPLAITKVGKISKVKDIFSAFNKLAKNPKQLAKYLGKGSFNIKKLLKNTDFKAVYDDFISGATKRKFADRLNIEEEAILRFYTTEKGYKDFNKALRGEIPMTDFYKSQEKLMNDALEKLPNHNNQTLLWRGLKNTNLDDIKKIYKEGDVIIEKNFVSTTYNIDDFIKSSRIRNFDYIIKIEGKNGKLIETISALPEEAEVLFKSNTSFKVEKAGFDLHPDINYEDLNGMPFIWTIKLKEL